MTDNAEVLVLCKQSRQVGDDLYVNGQQYKIAAERAAKYGDYFTVLTVTEGDEYDGMKVAQLQDIVKNLGIEGVDSSTRRPALLEAIRMRNARNTVSPTATGKSEEQDSNFSPGMTTKSGKSSGSDSKESDPNE